MKIDLHRRAKVIAGTHNMPPLSITFGAHTVALLACTVIILLIGQTSTVTADDGSSLEYKIKATYLYNFAKYIRWNNGMSDVDVDNSIRIGVLGMNRFEAAIEFFRQQKTDHNVEFFDIVTIEEAGDIDILFVSASEEADTRNILQAARGRNLVTVGEVEDFAEQGGVIEFTLEDDKVRFIINLRAARREGLVISSKLLRVASRVIE